MSTLNGTTSFRFTFVLSGVDDKTPDLEDKLFESRCSDALINFRNGTVYLDFDRGSDSLENAVMSAIKDVESAKLSAKVVSIGPDAYVNESEIADRLSTNRQTVSLWVTGIRRIKVPFPKPVLKLNAKSPLWRWYEVAKWLYSQGKIKDSTIVDDAEFIENLNVVLAERDEKILQDRKQLLEKLRKLDH